MNRMYVQFRLDGNEDNEMLSEKLSYMLDALAFRPDMTNLAKGSITIDFVEAMGWPAARMVWTPNE